MRSSPRISTCRERRELAAVHSPHAHALIKSIDTSAAEKMPGVIGVMTAERHQGDEPVEVPCARPVRSSADAKVRYIGGPGRRNPLPRRGNKRWQCSGRPRVDYEPLPVMMTPRRSPGRRRSSDPFRPAEPLLHPAPDSGRCGRRRWPNPLQLLKADFSTQIVHQAATRTRVCVAYLEEDEGDDLHLVVIGRSINIHSSVWACFRMPSGTRTSVMKGGSGGQFGIKLEYHLGRIGQRQRRFTSSGLFVISPA